jgi:hypothetical protein
MNDKTQSLSNDTKTLQGMVLAPQSQLERMQDHGGLGDKIAVGIANAV